MERKSNFIFEKNILHEPNSIINQLIAVQFYLLTVKTNGSFKMVIIRCRLLNPSMKLVDTMKAPNLWKYVEQCGNFSITEKDANFEYAEDEKKIPFVKMIVQHEVRVRKQWIVRCNGFMLFGKFQETDVGEQVDHGEDV